MSPEKSAAPRELYEPSSAGMANRVCASSLRSRASFGAKGRVQNEEYQILICYLSCKEKKEQPNPSPLMIEGAATLLLLSHGKATYYVNYVLLSLRKVPQHTLLYHY